MDETMSDAELEALLQESRETAADVAAFLEAVVQERDALRAEVAWLWQVCGLGE